MPVDDDLHFHFDPIVHWLPNKFFFRNLENVYIIQSMRVIDIDTMQSANMNVADIKNQVAQILYSDTCDDESRLNKSCFSPQMCKQRNMPQQYVFLDPSMVVFVRDTSVIATIIVSRDCPAESTDTKDRFISDFCVHSEHRRSGIGGRILQYVIENMCPSDIYLTVHRLEHAPKSVLDRIILSRYIMLLNFYSKHGFKTLRHTRDLTVMKKCR